MSQQTTETVITKTVTVNAPVERAFRVFTEEIHSWWPLRTHAVDTENSDRVILEGHEGGRLFERTPAGEEHVWGVVGAWDPPHRVGYSWYPGRGAETAQEVEVTFSPVGESTRVDVRHWGWEKLGDRMEPIVAEYTTGWDKVLGRYVEAANA
jgi:uncharacterized protein YndB with AHSA1/START domain